MPFVRRSTEVAEHQVHFRTTPVELAAIDAAAKLAGVSRGEWVRGVVLAAAATPEAAPIVAPPVIAASPPPLPTTPPEPPALPVAFPAIEEAPAVVEVAPTAPPVAEPPLDPRALATRLREAARTKPQIKPGVVLGAHLRSAVAPHLSEGDFLERIRELEALGLASIVAIPDRSALYVRVG